MKRSDWLREQVRIVFTTAEPERILNLAQKAGIDLRDVHYTNDLEVICKVSRKDYNRTRKLIERTGCEISSFRKFGISYLLLNTAKRPVFLLTILFLTFLTFFLPTRVLFVRVEGNKTLPKKQILECAQSCGIYFGASRSTVRSEKVKNSLLHSVPELAWAGITTDGCTAVISVREKEAEPEGEQPMMVTGIYASCDGVVEQCVVTSGNVLCKVGDAVKEGQLLVSGYTDCGISIRATRSEAEIFARTIRSLSVKSMSQTSKREKETGRSAKYSLIIGKKQINFYKDSGISDSSCVKMREELCLTLPGGFKLPLCIVRERIVSYDTSASTQENFEWIGEFAYAYLQRQMLAGSILSESCDQMHSSDVYEHRGSYHCYEMIGVEKVEEIIK